MCGGRSLRGNVDRNKKELEKLDVEDVVPYVGTWIEISRSLLHIVIDRVVPYVGTWIEISHISARCL